MTGAKSTDELRPILTEESTLLEDVLNKKYAFYIKDKHFSVVARGDDSAVYVTVTLSNDDESYYYPVDARMKYKVEEMEQGEAALFLLDYIDAYFEEYLTESEDMMLCIDWADHEYDAVNFQIRGQIFNKKLEEMADKFLKDHSSDE
jgi:hypothetical protein